MLSPHRRRALLARALHGARRERRAHPVGRSAHGEPDALGRQPRATSGSRRWSPPAARPATARSTTTSPPAAWSTSWCATPTTRRACSRASRPRAATRARCAPRSPPTCGRRSTTPGSSCAPSTSREGAGERILRLLEWVKHRSLLFNGAYANTMLRNDAFYFTQLGTFLERADNTARILDVKYHVLLPKTRERRRPARLLPVGVDPARGLGAARLSLGLPRAADALDDRGAADPAPGDAALAAAPATRRSRATSSCWPRPTAASAASATGAPARSTRGCATAASTASSRRACTSS